ncbi:MAG TPA: hypothetical protein VF772_22575 [Terriglobales bacterium]
MKNIACQTLMTLSLILIALVPAYAVTVNIPFSFTVDDVRMPAGEYVISSPTEHVVIIRHVGGPETKATIANNGSTTDSDGRAKLVFHRYGNAYFLAAAWLPNSAHAREFYTPANETQLARNSGQDVVELPLLAKK